METERLLDDVGRLILSELQGNARLNYTELGRRVGLTPTAVAERVRRLEDAGVIVGYRVELNAEMLGLPIVAYIRIATTTGRSPQLDALILKCPEVTECHLITGPDSYILKVVVPSVHHLQKFIETLRYHGQSTTSVVLSTLVGHRALVPNEPIAHGGD